MKEALKSIETARETGARSHLLAWSEISGLGVTLDWIKQGHIGELKEIHNWSSRPMWPQWTSNPEETPAIPDGFDWQMWLGPVPDRAYHPNYGGRRTVWQALWIRKSSRVWVSSSSAQKPSTVGV